MNAPEAVSAAPRRYSVADIHYLLEKGIVARDAKFELLDGKVIDMSPKGPLHEDARRAVNRWLKSLPDQFESLAETTLYLDETSFLEPDYVVFDTNLDIRDLTPSKVLLAIEVGHDSWSYDISEKATRYAAHGVQEYWAIHAPTRMVRVHRGASGAGWADVRDVPAGTQLFPLCAPATPLRLAI
jgi:Uma2 family endonuclease